MYTYRPAQKSDQALLYTSLTLALILVSLPGLLSLVKLISHGDSAIAFAVFLWIITPFPLAMSGIYSVIVLMRIDSLRFKDLFASGPLEDDFQNILSLSSTSRSKLSSLKKLKRSRVGTLGFVNIVATVTVMIETMIAWFFVYGQLWTGVTDAAERMPGWLGVMFSLAGLGAGTAFVVALLALVMGVILIPSVRMFSYALDGQVSAVVWVYERVLRLDSGLK